MLSVESLHFRPGAYVFYLPSVSPEVFSFVKYHRRNILPVRPYASRVQSRGRLLFHRLLPESEFQTDAEEFTLLTSRTSCGHAHTH